MGDDPNERPARGETKLTYTIFPKDATAKEIYEYLIARAEEDEKARDDASGETTAWWSTSTPGFHGSAASWSTRTSRAS